MRAIVKRPLKVRYAMDSNVMFLDLHPGITEEILRHQLNTPGIKGIVLKTFGAGNAPTSQWFSDAIRDAVNRDIVILNITQCVNGGVHPTRYVAGDLLSATGVVSGSDITFEAAITKMMYLFGMNLSPAEVTTYLRLPLAGEMSVHV